MATFFLALSKKSDTNSQKEIRLRFKHGKFDQQSKTNIFIQPEFWDFTKSEIIIPNFRLMTKEQKELKAELTSKINRLGELTEFILSAFTEADKTSMSNDWLKLIIDKFNFPEKYQPAEAIPETTTLFQFISKFIETAPERKDKQTGRFLTYNNIQQYKATEKHLKIFAKSIKKKDFNFEDINQRFYDKFVSYLQNEIPKTDSKGKPIIDENGNPILRKESFTLNSVGKHIRVLKLMLNEATLQGFNTSTYYNSFHVFTEDTDTVYLSEAELCQLKETDLSEMPHLERVRDWFLLLAWTGSRFSDLTKIAKTDIKDGFITFRQQKTNNRVTIPLHPVVLKVLEKYSFSLPEEISNQKFNDYIKEACRLAEINSDEQTTITKGGVLKTETSPKYELISSHTGRRSFATNMYKRGLPTLMIMSITGHKTEKSFLKYIKIRQDEHAQMMKDKWAEIYK